MSNEWITVTKHKSKKKNKNLLKKTIKNKPKLNNHVKEKILQYCNIVTDDFSIFHTWKHIYILGCIKKNNSSFRLENKLLVLEYLNKFKIYKNYKKGNEQDFINITDKLVVTPEILYNEMKENNLYLNDKLLQEHNTFSKIYNKFNNEKC
jgi:hypothetical protein